jgi:hypothetical protein
MILAVIESAARWPSCLCVQADLLNWINSILPVQFPSAKIFSFTFDPNHFYILAIPAHTKGRFAIVTNAGSGCDGREWRD